MLSTFRCTIAANKCGCVCAALSSLSIDHALCRATPDEATAATVSAVCLNVEYSSCQQKERVWAVEAGGGRAEETKRLGLDKEKIK